MCKKTKRAVSLIATICILFSLGTVMANGTLTSIEISSSTVRQGGSVVVEVSVKDIPEDSKGVSFGIGFDKNVLQVTPDNIAKSDVIDHYSADVEDESLGFAGLFKVGESLDFSEKIVVASITFIAKSNAPVGDSELSFIAAQYDDIDFDDITTDGIVTITKRSSGSVASSAAGQKYYVDGAEDKEPEDKEPEDKEPEDKEPEDKEPEDKEPEDKPAASADDFTDLAGFDWAKGSIDYLVERGIISGTTNTTYEPGRPITRAEFTKLVVSVFGFKPGDKSISFNDISEDDWYYDFVAAGAATEIISGYPDGDFLPNNSITRQEMAAIVMRAFSAAGVSLAGQDDITFADADEIGEWAKEAIAALSSMGILKGRDNNLFAPTDNLTRAEAATVITTLLKLISVE